MAKDGTTDVLKAAGSWIVYSYLTALSLYALFESQGVTTARGAWAVMVERYQDVTAFLFGGMASLVPFNWFEVTPAESDAVAASALIMIPFSVAQLEKEGLLLAGVITGLLWLGLGIDPRSYEWLPFGLGLPGATLLLLLPWVTYVAVKEGVGWKFGQNLLGAALLLLGLMLTGFFSLG